MPLFSDDLDPLEVEDFVYEIVNNEFDTVVEDGSLTNVSVKDNTISIYRNIKVLISCVLAYSLKWHR